MRRRKTEDVAKGLVSKFRDSGDLVDFVEQCMQSAA